MAEKAAGLAASGGARPRRTRRGRRRSGTWKPFSELSWEERRDLEERAARKREAQELLAEAPAAAHHDRRPRRGRAPGAGLDGAASAGGADGNVPPAPLITSAALMDEREARTAVPSLDDADDALPGGGGGGGGAARTGQAFGPGGAGGGGLVLVFEW